MTELETRLSEIEGKLDLLLSAFVTNQKLYNDVLKGFDNVVKQLATEKPKESKLALPKLLTV